MSGTPAMENYINNQDERLELLERENGKLREAASTLLDAMETCHICKGLIQIDDGPTHCEDCSWDCQEHEGDECPTVWTLHQRLRAALASPAPAYVPAMEANNVDKPSV